MLARKNSQTVSKKISTFDLAISNIVDICDDNCWWLPYESLHVITDKNCVHRKQVSSSKFIYEEITQTIN